MLSEISSSLLMRSINFVVSRLPSEARDVCFWEFSEDAPLSLSVLRNTLKPRFASQERAAAAAESVEPSSTLNVSLLSRNRRGRSVER